MNTIKSKLVGEDFMPFRSLIWFDSNGARYDTMTEFDGINHRREEIEANMNQKFSSFWSNSTCMMRETDYRFLPDGKNWFSIRVGKHGFMDDFGNLIV